LVIQYRLGLAYGKGLRNFINLSLAYSISSRILVAAFFVYLTNATMANEVKLSTSTSHPNYVYYVFSKA